MKVVLFCGGYGTRMRDGASDLPKPLHTVGPRPLLWHVMRYYAHFGHTDFVLCLGYGAEHVKDYFLTYSETASNDFVLRRGEVELLGSDIRDWTVTFVDTGLSSSIGERLRRVRHHVTGEEVFLADIWPSQEEISDTVARCVQGRMFTEEYASVYSGDERWQSLPTPEGDRFAWDDRSTYIRRPSYFDNLPTTPAEPTDILGARCLVKVGDSVTTDHISPAGGFRPETPAGKYLLERGVEQRAFNS